jgi:hypothetical protein
MKTKQSRSQLDLKISLLVLAFCFCTVMINLPASGFSPEKAGFSVKFKDEISPYRVMGVFVLPGELLTLEAQDPLKKHLVRLLRSHPTNGAGRLPGKRGFIP